MCDSIVMSTVLFIPGENYITNPQGKGGKQDICGESFPWHAVDPRPIETEGNRDFTFKTENHSGVTRGNDYCKVTFLLPPHPSTPVIFLDVYAQLQEIQVHLRDVELKHFVEDLHCLVIVNQ